MLLDPATLFADGGGALAQWEPSADGRSLLYAVQQGGSDWRTLRVLDVESGRTLPDRIERVRYSSLAWRADGRGFFYARFDSVGGKDMLRDQRVYYHALGTAQAADPLVYATPAQPGLRHGVRVTDDGRWLVIQSSPGTGDARGRGAGPAPAGCRQADPPRRAGCPAMGLCRQCRRQALFPDAGRRPARPHRHVRCGASRSSPAGGRRAAATRAGRRQSGRRAPRHRLSLRRRIRRRAGRSRRAVRGPGADAGASVRRRALPGGPAIPRRFFRFSDFTTPDRIYRFDVATGATTPFAIPRLPFVPSRFQHRDGHVPLARRHARAAVPGAAQGCRQLRQARADTALRLWRLCEVGDAVPSRRPAWPGWSRAA